MSVNRTLGGVTVQGYPKTYDGQNYWGNPTYPTLTDTQMKQLSESDFAFRYADFVAYVESVESGLDFTYDIVGDGAIKTDSNCLTTTTTIPVTTTTTTVTVIPTHATWWTTANSGSCGDPCGQQVYTQAGYLASPLAISYFYNTPALIPNDYYAPGIGVIGYTSQFYGIAEYTANISIDGSLSFNAQCG